MTTEEKARAYDEALEWAKKFHTPDSNNSNLKAVLELIFPQLKESEDERIRKNILKKMRACQKQSNFFSNDEIAWLEKQKEQKPTDEQFPPLEGLDAIKAKYYDDGFKNGFDEGVESVKPAEWSEEDDKTINNARCWIAEYAGYLMDKNYSKASMLMSLTDKLKSLRPSWKPSEEQMKKKSRVKEEPEYYQHFDPDC